MYRLRQRSVRKILNRYEGDHGLGERNPSEPSVKYVKYGPSFENLREKLQNVEESEGIYEILDGEGKTEGVANLDELYDKLDFK